MNNKKQKKKTRFALLCIIILLLVLTVVLTMVPKLLLPQVYPRNYAASVQKYAQEYGIEEDILYAVIKTESGFDEKAESDVGARGLMQITEETFSWIKSKIAPNEDITFDDLYVADINIRFGTYYMSHCLARYENDLKTAAAAYHSGWGTVDTLLDDSRYSQDGKTLIVFPYTQMNLYTKKIQKNYAMYQKIYLEEE